MVMAIVRLLPCALESALTQYRRVHDFSIEWHSISIYACRETAAVSIVSVQIGGIRIRQQSTNSCVDIGARDQIGVDHHIFQIKHAQRDGLTREKHGWDLIRESAGSRRRLIDEYGMAPFVWALRRLVFMIE